MIAKSILTGAFSIAITGAAAGAYCSEPTAPSCAMDYGRFDDKYEFDRCKDEMASYLGDVEDYVSCLRRASEEAISEYEDAVASFNRRARG